MVSQIKTGRLESSLTTHFPKRYQEQILKSLTQLLILVNELDRRLSLFPSRCKKQKENLGDTPRRALNGRTDVSGHRPRWVFGEVRKVSTTTLFYPKGVFLTVSLR